MTAQSWVVDPSTAGLRLDKFLAAADRLGSRGRASDALARGKLFVNDVEASPADASRRLSAGDVVRWWADRPGSSKKKTTRRARAGELSIVFEDDALVVVNKPAGLLAVPLERKEDAPSVQDELVLHFRSKGKRRPFVVHRIDRDTSGLVVFAKTAAAQARLKDQFRRREPERVYLAVVYGCPSPRSGAWRDRLVWDQTSLIQKQTHTADPRGQDAECRYKVVETFDEASLIEVQLVTGRRNQIRLQARLRGHTLVGESRYTYGPEVLRPVAFSRQALHAWRLRFRHPVSGEPLTFEVSLPSDIKELIEKLRKGNLFQGRRSLSI